MDTTDIEDRVERTVRSHDGPHYRLRRDSTWLILTPEEPTLPAHGWKLHISSRVATFPELVERLVPVLLAEGCAFKLARSPQVLRRLNSGLTSPAAVGKAFTIYPDQARVRELGLRLAELLRGAEGPRILSDRAVDPAAPVYYRYGPFRRSWQADASGRLVTLIHGPAGEEFGALATMRYRQPSWTVDPFTGERGGHAPSPSRQPLLGGHYRIVAGVYESGRGNVFRAVDERTGATVVVKQARALVDEHDEAGDVRLRLRNERRVLQALEDMPGVPRFLDHFRHGPDEFLVTTDAGPHNLEAHVLENGCYAPDDLDRLATQLARIVLDLHARGVVARDLSTRNVVLDGDRASLIDLGLAHYEDVHVPGGTPGYAPARQRRGEPPRDTDDLHALGMVLLFAAHGQHPVTLGEDLDNPALRARQTIRSRYGSAPAGVPGAVADLISGDAAPARAAARRLADGTPSTSSAPLPAPPSVAADVIAGNLLADLLHQTREVLAAPPNTSIANDASVYSGAAGIGLELLHHLDQPGVADCLRDLVPFTVRAMAAVDLPPGLLAGRTGVDVFLARAADHGFRTADHPGPYLPGRDWKPEGDDMIAGAAGVGLGHVLLHRATGDPAHLAVARRCAESVLDHPAPATKQDSDPLPAPAAVEPSAGRAHGLAGTAELLLCVGHRTGDRALLAAGADRARLLARRARSLAARAQTRFAASLAVSWCQGLAGITQSLLFAGAVLDDDSLTGLARELGDVCTAFLPRVVVPSQCCGAAGVGNMLIDLALVTGDEHFWDAATAAGVQMMLRGAGTDRHPVFHADNPEDSTASWAFGVAGTLSYFRRLARRGGTAGLPLPDWPR
jgi:serine/threonine protein kinase